MRSACDQSTLPIDVQVFHCKARDPHVEAWRVGCHLSRPLRHLTEVPNHTVFERRVRYNTGCSEVRGAETLTNIFVYDSLSWISYHKVVRGWQKCLPLVASFRTTHSPIRCTPLASEEIEAQGRVDKNTDKQVLQGLIE
ncbi:uncharacterized protein TNCV_2327591 [Trichonephila clavipes]|nr:uncharacterized protein TNCV_2327591 [Trichonephila clavipes]